MFLGAASFEQLVSSGKVRLEGNSGPLEQIKGMRYAVHEAGGVVAGRKIELIVEDDQGAAGR